MNETFWGLYDAQIAALRNCSSPEEANLIILETAKFLMENIDLSDSTIAQYDKFGIRKLFAAHNALGGAVTSFYDSQKKQLDPAARNGAIGQKLTAISEQITYTANELVNLQELEKELFAKEDELIAREKELADLKQKADHLRNTETSAVTQIQHYKEQFTQLDRIITGYVEEIAFWEAHLGEDSAIIAKMKVYGIGSIGELLDSIEKLKTNISQDLKALDVVIKKIVDQEKHAREVILRKQNKMV